MNLLLAAFAPWIAAAAGAVMWDLRSSVQLTGGVLLLIWPVVVLVMRIARAAA